MVDGSWTGVRVRCRENSWLQGDGYGDELQGGCLLWLGIVVCVYNCALMALLSIIVDNHWFLAVGQLQGLGECWVL